MITSILIILCKNFIHHVILKKKKGLTSMQWEPIVFSSYPRVLQLHLSPYLRLLN